MVDGKRIRPSDAVLREHHVGGSAPMPDGVSLGGTPEGLVLAYEERILPAADNRDALTRAAAERRRQPYLASIPAEIADLRIDIQPSVLAEADDAARAITRFDAEIPSFPAPFSSVLLRSESASSSQIENLTSGARAIAEAEIDERAEGNAALIVRNVRALEAAIALSDDISNETIIEMQRQLLEGVDPQLVGRYRDEQVFIGGNLPHDAAFVPPHHERVKEAMDDLIAFMRRTDLPALVQAAVAHAQFETIHPFPDGNGRTGRALVQAMLRNAGLLRHVTVPISSGLLVDVDAYFDALGSYRDGDPSPVVSVFANASLASLANSRELAKDIREMQVRWDGQMSGLRADATARKVARLSVEFPALNTRVAMERTGASQPAVGNAFDQLVERGILKRANSKKRNRIWLNNDVIGALDAFAARSGRRRAPGY